MMNRNLIIQLVLFVITILPYSNTFNHQYALDDGMVILNNEYVLKGTSGITQIFSKDMLDSYYRRMGSNGRLAGGRYRPLSIASFAIEQELIGKRDSVNFSPDEWDKNFNGLKEPEEDLYRDGIYDQKDAMAEGFALRHIVNVLLYAFCICLIFLLMTKVVSPGNWIFGIIVSLLFAFHPIHTEVVANVKSRDEILSLIFILTTILSTHQFYKSNKIIHLFFAGLSFLMALFSKEYGVLLFLLLPISIYLFEEKLEKRKFIKGILVLGTAFIIYAIMRLQVAPFFKEDIGVESEILNNPYLFATPNQAFDTKIFILLKYLSLLIFPDTLISDYGYNSIPYIDSSNPLFLVSLILHFALVSLFIYFMKKRNWLAFPIAFYLLHIALVSNLVGFNLGATMGERLIFHSSLGFCIISGYGIFKIMNIRNLRVPIIIAFSSLIFLFGNLTWQRNKDWENDDTLCLADVKKQPESMALNNNASATFLFLSSSDLNKGNEKQFVQSAKKYAEKAISMNPNYVNALINLGICYGKQNNLDSVAFVIAKLDSLYPTHPLLKNLKENMALSLHANALKLTEVKDFENAIPILIRSLKYNNEDIKVLYDLGVCYFNIGNIEKAKVYFKQGYSIDPNDKDIQRVIPLLK